MVVRGEAKVEVTVEDLERAGGDTSVYDALMNIMTNGKSAYVNNGGVYHGSECTFDLTKIERKFHK